MSACQHLPTRPITSFALNPNTSTVHRFKQIQAGHSSVPRPNSHSKSFGTAPKRGQVPSEPIRYCDQHFLLSDDTNINTEQAQERSQVAGSSTRPDCISRDHEAAAKMEHRTKAQKVTLPPLSSLTASIDLDRRHERQLASGHRRNSIEHGDESFQSHTSPAYSASPRYASAQSSVAGSSYTRNAAPLPSSSLAPPSTLERRTAETNRPRAYSSPHRHRLHDTATTPSLSDSSEVDRILEALIHIQDINRRLGLRTGGPVSPSIFQRSDAAALLRDKVDQELDIMAHFSQSRAEAVAHNFGFAFRAVASSGSRQVISSHHSGTYEGAVSSGQAAYPPRQSNDHGGRPRSSTGRLLSNESDRTAEYDEQYEAEETYYEERGSANLAHSSRGEASLRSVSRSASFDQPRDIDLPYRSTHHLGHSASHFESSQRLPHERGYGTLPVFAPEARHQQQLELLDHRRLTGKGMKRVKKRKNEHHQECLGCQAKETPEWRKGPMGPRTLCNACGLLYAKLTKRKQQEAEAAAKASGKTAEEIVREREESPGAKQASLEALRAELNLANGVRNRAMSTSSSSAPLSHAAMPYEAHVRPASHAPARPHDMPHDRISSGQAWPTQQRESFQPFAHQIPYHGPLVSDPERRSSGIGYREPHVSGSQFRPYTGSSIPNASGPRYPEELYQRAAAGRSNSLGYVESHDHLAGRRSSRDTSASGSTMTPSRLGPLRPHSRQASPEPLPSLSHAGRLRSNSALHLSGPPPFARPYDRSTSPAFSGAPQDHATSGPSMSRRHHPCL